MRSFLKLIHRQKGFLIPFIFITVSIYSVILLAPIRQAFEYDPDEGTALIKTQLYLQGFSLYKEIWDDQPPLLTVILSYCFKLFSPSIYNARILILIFSAILLWTLYLIIKRLNGAICALIATVFLILSTNFLRLSISVMPGIPSLSFAILSIYCIIRYKKIAKQTPGEISKFPLYHNKYHLRLFLILSGICMAVSLQIKLITAFLIPIILLETFFIKKTTPIAEKQKKGFFYPVVFWLIGFIAVNLIIIIIFFRFNVSLFFNQLFEPHLTRLELERNNFTVISRFLFNDYDITLLALTHTISAAQKRKKRLYLPLFWLITIFFFLFIHRPLWDHYYTLIAIPLCWLAAIHCKDFINTIVGKNPCNKKSFLHWLTASLVILTIIRLPIKYHSALESINTGTTVEERKLINLLRARKNNTRWLITDRPIFAFYSGILVPPELALISNKRILARHFTENYLSGLIAKYKPEQILLTRFKVYGDKLLIFIKQDYTKIYQGKLYNRIWIPLYIQYNNKQITINKQRWQYKLPSIQGGRSYTSSGKDALLYLRNNVPQ